MGCDGVVTNCHILFTVRQTPICVNVRMCVYDEYVCIPVSYPAVLIPIYHPNVAVVVVVVAVVVLVVDTYKRYIVEGIYNIDADSQSPLCVFYRVCVCVCVYLQ